MSEPHHPNGDSDSNDMARSIIDETIGQVCKKKSSMKPPLPHHSHNHNHKSKKKNKKNPNTNNNNNDDNDQSNTTNYPVKAKPTKHGKRNMIYRPDPLMGDLSSCSTASASPNVSPDAHRQQQHHLLNQSKDNNNKSETKQNNDNSKNNKNKNSEQQSNKKSNTNGSSFEESKKDSNTNGNNSDKNSDKNTSSNNNKKSGKKVFEGSSLNKPRKERVLTKEERRERRRKLEDPSMFPKRYEVQIQARVRVDKEISSQHLTDLPEGSVVTVEEIDGHRARISRPLHGWVSIKSKFGARIMLPTSQNFSKIGGKLIFKTVTNETTAAGYAGNSNGVLNDLTVTAKVVDFNENNNLYKIRFDNGANCWIDMDSRDDVLFVKQHAVKSAKLAADAPLFNPHTSCQAFFNQFFCKDYPEYEAQSSSTTRHMDISHTVINAHSVNTRNPRSMNASVPGMHGNNPRHPNAGYPPPNAGRQPMGPGGPWNGIPGQPHPPRSHMRGYPPNHAPPRRDPMGYDPRNGHPTMNGGYPPPHPHSQHPQHHSPQGGDPRRHRSDRNMGRNPNPMQNARGGRSPNDNPNNPNGMAPTSGQSPTKKTHPPPPPDRDPSNPRIVYDEPFLAKVKEIERRIVQHLHQRGYNTSHPDYHRYLQKAKELAITKASKERHKQYQLARAMVTGEKIQTKMGPLTPQQYREYLEYKKQEHRRIQAATQQSNNGTSNSGTTGTATNNNSSNTGNTTTQSTQRLTPHQRGNSVKGLIVLRGLPGSGKTTLAKKLAQRSKNARICTEDRYHWSGKEDGVGEYKFQPQLVFLAREWCTAEIRECIDNNVTLIILDNHNARISMYEDHIQYAVENGYRFRIIEFVASEAMIDRYRARSYKKFPREVYVKLLKLWENDPRTELINPTFDQKLGGGGGVGGVSGAGGNKVSKTAGNSNNDGVNQSKDGGNQSKTSESAVSQQKQSKQSSVIGGGDGSGSKNKNNNGDDGHDYSRRPLEQGLNLMHNSNNKSDN